MHSAAQQRRHVKRRVKSGSSAGPTRRALQRGQRCCIPSPPCCTWCCHEAASHCPYLLPHLLKECQSALLRPELVLPAALVDGLAPTAPLWPHRRMRVGAEVQVRLTPRQVDCGSIRWRYMGAWCTSRCQMGLAEACISCPALGHRQAMMQYRCRRRRRSPPLLLSSRASCRQLALVQDPRDSLLVLALGARGEARAKRQQPAGGARLDNHRG